MTAARTSPRSSAGKTPGRGLSCPESDGHEGDECESRDNYADLNGVANLKRFYIGIGNSFAPPKDSDEARETCEGCSNLSDGEKKISLLQIRLRWPPRE